MFNKSEYEMENIDYNVTVFVAEIEDSILKEESNESDELVAETWIGIILTLLVFLCACSMCGFLVYSRFQIWKRRDEIRGVDEVQTEEGRPYSDPLPSYTIVSGLPSYTEALEQLRMVKEKERSNGDVKKCSQSLAPECKTNVSVIGLFANNNCCKNPKES